MNEALVCFLLNIKCCWFRSKYLLKTAVKSIFGTNTTFIYANTSVMADCLIIRERRSLQNFMLDSNIFSWNFIMTIYDPYLLLFDLCPPGTSYSCVWVPVNFAFSYMCLYVYRRFPFLITYGCQFQACRSSCFARCNPFAHLHSSHPWSWWSCTLPIICCSIQYASLECDPDSTSWLSLMQLLSSHADLQTTLTSGNLQWLCYLSSTSKFKQCLHF